MSAVRLYPFQLLAIIVPFLALLSNCEKPPTGLSPTQTKANVTHPKSKLSAPRPKSELNSETSKNAVDRFIEEASSDSYIPAAKYSEALKHISNVNLETKLRFLELIPDGQEYASIKTVTLGELAAEHPMELLAFCKNNRPDLCNAALYHLGRMAKTEIAWAIMSQMNEKNNSQFDLGSMAEILARRDLDGAEKFLRGIIDGSTLKADALILQSLAAEMATSGRIPVLQQLEKLTLSDNEKTLIWNTIGVELAEQNLKKIESGESLQKLQDTIGQASDKLLMSTTTDAFIRQLMKHNLNASLNAINALAESPLKDWCKLAASRRLRQMGRLEQAEIWQASITNADITR